MGYTTDFYGEIKLDRKLDDAHAEYLRAFAETRRMARDNQKAGELADPVRKAVNLPVGKDGGYFVGGTGFCGQNSDPSVMNYNKPPEGQPGLWCQWVPNEDGTAIEWDQGESFYDYVSWMEYIMEHFIGPWGYVANGSIEWNGEEYDDIGLIKVEDNKVTSVIGVRVYPGGNKN